MMSTVQDASGKYLWWYLQSLEFHLEVASSAKGKPNIRHLNLGVNMFDKPNKEASYLVIHFLFKKLNPSRVQDVFRHCWPVLDHKTDAAFRKVTFAWLQEIMNEKGSNFPRVVASHLNSSFGPRFVNLMLHFAKYVMLKTMKTFKTDGSWVPEAAAVPASSQELEMKRFQVVKRRFQKASVEQDALMQDYQRRARHLEKSLKEHKADDVKYDDLLKQYENKSNLEKDLLEKIAKVRHLWAEIDRALSRLEGERSVLASVLEGRVDQYVLDGKEISVNIPAVLLERMEKLTLQTSAGSLYEGGQPVILPLLELLNVGLKLLSEERAKLSPPILQLSHQPLQEQALLMTRSKETLKNIRRKLCKEDIPQIKSNIRKLELDWEKKWAEFLRRTPLISFLNDDPVLDFLSPMPPLAFEAASEVSFKASLFSQYPAQISEPAAQPLKDEPELEIKTDSDFLSKSFPVENKMGDLLFFGGCCDSPRPVSPCVVHPVTPTCVKVPSGAPTPSPFQAGRRRPLLSQTKTSALKPKAHILELEYENLASQFAEAVTMSPVDGRKSGMELEQVLNTLADPFTTKKQLPRTPESLITDVRTSWRKAMEEGKAEKKHDLHENSHSLVRTPVSMVEPSPGRVSFQNSAMLSADPLPCGILHSPHSTVSWDTSQLEALSQCSSNLVHFSIAHETFPDAENDSFNSSDCSQEAEELLLPPVVLRSPEEGAKCKTVRRRLDESPFAGRSKETKSDVVSAAIRTSPGLGPCSGEKVFSLELESFSSPQREELTLPTLITFSPMDEF